MWNISASQKRKCDHQQIPTNPSQKSPCARKCATQSSQFFRQLNNCSIAPKNCSAGNKSTVRSDFRVEEFHPTMLSLQMIDAFVLEFFSFVICISCCVLWFLGGRACACIAGVGVSHGRGPCRGGSKSGPCERSVEEYVDCRCRSGPCESETRAAAEKLCPRQNRDYIALHYKHCTRCGAVQAQWIIGIAATIALLCFALLAPSESRELQWHTCERGRGFWKPRTASFTFWKNASWFFISCIKLRVCRTLIWLHLTLDHHQTNGV